ncbi:MAG: ComEC/Rec2 family competence protein [Ruminococcus sp.]|nr:ComEC/Rec2 family competence protein [Ruminococcus sp.]
MKRLFALIGITCLSTLIVVFNFYSLNLIIALVAISIFTATLFFTIKLNKKRKSAIAVAAVVVLLSSLLFTYYQNYVYTPVANKYSDTEINFEGFVCEEVQQTSYNYSYYIQTDTINNEKAKIKFILYSDNKLNMKSFNEIAGTVVLHKVDADYLLCKGIFLTADNEDLSSLSVSDSIRKSPYYYAVSVRVALKDSLDSLLKSKYSSLCKAVLLGDKLSLSPKVKNDFSLTGTTFMIVVSGMHLSIISAFATFLVSKLTRNRFIISTLLILTTVFYMAITGFTFSVVRAGVMVIIAYCGKMIFRKADSLSSLGIAAIILCVQNPFVVGDVGFLCSFFATAGIVLWSDKMTDFLLSKVSLKSKFVNDFISAICVSVSAQLWVLPISFIYFQKTSLFTILISVICSPLVSILLVCSLVAAVLNMCGVISFLAIPFAFVCGASAEVILFLEDFYASIPFCSISTDNLYMHIWLVITILLTIVGFIIKSNKYLYTKCVIIISLITLCFGWAVNIVYNYFNPVLTVWSVGRGMTVTVENGLDISFLSCGGKMSAYNNISETIGKDYLSVNLAIVAKENYKYTAYINAIASEFDETNILLYHSNEYSDINVIAENYYYDNTEFRAELCYGVYSNVLCIDSVTYQLVQSDDIKILILPNNSDVSVLPDNYLDADFVICDKLPKNSNLLSCNSLIFSGTEYAFNKNYNSLKEITSDLILTDKNIKISLSNGGYNAEDY